MELETFQKYLGKVIKFLFGALLFLFLLSFLVFEGLKKSPEQQQQYIRQKLAEKSGLDFNENYPKPWPPVMNAEYPDFELIDQTGAQFKLSSLKGKILIIEYVDMSSPLSQAYSGAAEKGLFGLTDKYDEFTKPVEKLLAENPDKAVNLPVTGVQMVKIIVQTQNGEPPRPKDAEEWAAFFKYTKENNVIVAVPVKDIRGKVTDLITPGYHLTDGDLMLRVDSAGLTPKHNLQMTLVPLVAKLLP